MQSGRTLRRFLLTVLTVGLGLYMDGGGRAQDVVSTDESRGLGEAGPVGRLVRIPLPIQGLVDVQVRRAIEQALSELDRVQSTVRPVLVLEFWPPPDGSGESSEFGRALDLARFLVSPRVQAVRTVGYLPRTVRGHAVLVALACEELVMHPDAQLGAAGISEDHIDPTVRQGYKEIADRRRTIPAAVALGMLDASLHVQRVVTAAGTRFVLASDVPEIQRTTTVQAIDTVIPAGEVGQLSGDKLRLDYHFVSHLAQDRRQLAQALGIPPRELEIETSLGGAWQAIRIELQGPTTRMAVDRLLRGIDDRIRRQETNFICLVIDSPGGSLEESVRLADYLSIQDPTKVRTVAYVPREARADASLIALACDQLVMHGDARLGGMGASELSAKEAPLVMRSVRGILGNKSRSWSLAAAMINPALEVHRYALAGTTVTEYFCPDEVASQADPGAWRREATIVGQGQVLELSGDEAVHLQLARCVVADFDEFQQQFQLEATPELVEPNWAHELIGALAMPQVAAGLLFIGFFAMIAELSAPGIGVGGFLSAICFVLFFWSNFLQGTAGWLEVLLFVTGLTFIAMEVFVLPGFGIFGLGGLALVLASLVLASQTFVVPRNDYQARRLLESTLYILGVMGAVLMGAVMLQRYFKALPLVGRLQLAPPTGTMSEELARRESLVQYDHLLGQVGRTTTRLTPAGKANFEGALVDVVSDGMAIDRGQYVKVIHVSGNRVVVCES